MISSPRVLVFDRDRYDRELLSLALRSTWPELQVVNLESWSELDRELKAGPITAVIGDPRLELAEFSASIVAVRKRQPNCLFWLFTARDNSPSAYECIGMGVDGRDSKESSGYLNLSVRLQERLRQAAALNLYHANRIGTSDVSSLILKVVPGAAGLVDSEGNFQIVNQELEALLRRPRYELLGTALELLAARDDERSILRLQLGGATVPNFWWFEQHVEGRTSRQTVMLRPLGEPNQGPVSWIVSLRDPRLDAGGPGSQEQAARVVELEQLVLRLANDLRGPLDSLAGNAGWLTEQVHGTTEIGAAMNEIVALSHRMGHMLEGVVIDASLGGGRRDPEIASFDGLLAETIGFLQRDKLLREEAESSPERQLPATLRVNRQQLVQIFENLLANALKYRASLPPRIRMSTRDYGDSVRVNLTLDILRRGAP